MILTPHQPHQRHGDERETETQRERQRQREFANADMLRTVNQMIVRIES